ncbi:type IV pilus assembly family protein, partial [Dehalococcoides mccartyi]
YIDDMKQKNNTLEPQVQVQETALIQKRAELSAINIQLSNTQKSLTVIEPVVTVLNDMLWDMYQGRETITGDYKAIYNLHSSNIGLSAVNFDGESITVTGYGLTKTAVLEYAGILRGSNRWLDVVVINMEKVLLDDQLTSIYSFEFLLK